MHEVAELDAEALREHVSMIVDPGWTADHVRLRFVSVQELNAVLAEQEECFVEERLVDPANLTGSPVIRNPAIARRALLGVHRNTFAVSVDD